MRETSPTARRRRLGAELRRFREAAGLTSYEAAERLGWASNSKISRIENGRISVTWNDVAAMLDLYGVGPGEIRDRLITLARRSKEKSWWQPYSDLLDNKEYATVIDLETAASSARLFHPLMVPGLLQTPDYARAIIARSGPLALDDVEIERRVELRMERQAVLAEGGNMHGLWVVIDEAALHRVIGSPQIMRKQLRHLSSEARRRPVTVQVIPYTVGPHASLAGAFGIFSFPEADAGDVVFVDTLAGNLFLDRGTDVRTARIGFDHLRASALSAAESDDLIIRIAETYE
ncbi:helix-turn-helix domain-containing protein [Actinoallomurus rhizosphaericola]|uniref:helix-turn-helix domain-containing protein n=1 Tax=Actinoallomurus rhizosphaericola TaxID=2952536 RepID=UPI002091EF4E|nr:helix-turn-helix transcriptional regulator [Actinoallomurus rhizosphaericola]MCO5997765.1 helix-turn-helix domain-containing protein [Actinoallomurus rhizosphaericola]